MINETLQFGLTTIETNQPYNIVVQSFAASDLLIILFLVAVSSVALHEFGHMVMLKAFKKKPVVELKDMALHAGVEGDYISLTSQERVSVYLVGICSGLVPIFLAMFIHPAYVIVLLTYYFVISHDLDRLFIEYKESRKVKE